MNDDIAPEKMRVSMVRKSAVTVAITCHNRREMTMRAVGQVMRQAECDVIVVDDGSTDGTTDALARAYPGVRLIAADGDLYWAGGMALATNSRAESSDAVLWLNDDVSLDSDALDRLTDMSRSLGNSAIVVGALRETGNPQRISYSGMNRTASWRRLNFQPVPPGPEPIAVDTFNGNLVLLPTAVLELVGPIDRNMRHRMADFDYGLRARAMGVQVLLAPGTFGTCDRNSLEGTWADRSLSWRARWASFVSLKGFEPKSFRIFAKRHAGPVWCVYYVWPYVRFGFTLLIEPLIKLVSVVRSKI